MKKKRLIKAMGAAAVMAAILGTSVYADNEPVTITWAVFETDNFTADYYQHIIDTFEADNPNIKIEKILMTGDSRPQFLKTMLSAGNMPDVNIDPIDLADIEGVYAEVPEELLSKYEDSYIVTNNGSKNLIPAYTALRSQVYYNKQQFADAGITEIPETWDEFVEVCEKLKEAGFTPLMGVGAADSWATSFGYWNGVVNAEIEAVYPEFNKQVLAGEVSWTDPAIENALLKWQELINAGYYHKGSMSFSYTQANAEFLSGSAAMFMDGAWSSATIDSSEEYRDQFGVFMMPTPSGVKSYCTMPGYWAVSDTCENKEAAFTFCEYVLGGNEELYRYYLQADGVYSVTKEPVTYEMGALQTEFLGNYEGISVVPEITKVVGDYKLPSGFEDYTWKSLQNVFTGANVKTELETWDAEFERMLAG
ncbi:MAG: extracellular solute-binding protein [Candidatus Limivivens sp.]|nr:extracellular solute-binding protein [Candidatus Limivivens sp.]